jgi:hypothetical protein
MQQAKIGVDHGTRPHGLEDRVGYMLVREVREVVGRRRRAFSKRTFDDHAVKSTTQQEPPGQCRCNQ